MAMKPVKVSQLNGYIKRILQADPILGNVSVIGEISNIKFHGTGHVYFTLKDEGSKINCFLPSDRFESMRFELADGMEITAEGYIYLYEKGGTYSLNIRNIQVAGVGNLSIAFEKLKAKLSKEGLFDEKYKKPLPTFPKKVVVITSETGAAVRDIIKIIKNRNNYVDVLVYPVLVQGPGAAPDIAHALREVNDLFPDTDVIITGRGGGSMEELWAFNEEIVARAIFDSNIPVISAVGHEIDFTIADFVADRRAETPTAAAQMAVPDIGEVREYMSQIKFNLEHRLSSIVRMKELQLQRSNIDALQEKLLSRIDLHRHKIDTYRNDMYNNINNKINTNINKTEALKQQLEALNPKSIMDRGYSAVLDAEGKLVSSVDSFNCGDTFTTVMKDGTVEGRVLHIERGL